jgi:hypothetical protein
MAGIRLSSKSEMKIQKLLLLVLAFSLAPRPGHGQYTNIELERVIVSRSLSGHVYTSGLKSPVEGATVELCGTGWDTVIASTKTDDKGFFTLKKPPGRLFYIRVSLLNCDPLLVRVRVRRLATHHLTLLITVAT